MLPLPPSFVGDVLFATPKRTLHVFTWIFTMYSKVLCNRGGGGITYGEWQNDPRNFPKRKQNYWNFHEKKIFCNNLRHLTIISTLIFISAKNFPFHDREICSHESMWSFTLCGLKCKTEAVWESKQAHEIMSQLGMTAAWLILSREKATQLTSCLIRLDVSNIVLTHIPVWDIPVTYLYTLGPK